MKHVTVGAFAALLLVLALAGRVSGAGVAVEEEEVEVEDSSHSSRELHHVGPAPVLEEYELDPTCDYEAVNVTQHNATTYICTARDDNPPCYQHTVQGFPRC